ncbi:hypothetical protein CW704_03870, partial [Candidatus Bathyarchaeota archaeon]
MNLPSLWLLQYLIAAIISLMVSFYAVHLERKRPHPPSLALKYFFTFGLSIFVWEIVAYLQRSASNPDSALIFIRLLSISSVLSQSTYLAAILSIRKKSLMTPLIFLPAWINVCITSFISYDFRLTKYGWSYQVTQPSTAFFIVTLIYLGYLVATILSLIKLIVEARSKQLKRKYEVLLGSFLVFQAIGMPLTNYLLMINPNFPPLGGVLHLATFLFIAYALMIQEEKIPLISHFTLEDFPKVYSSFLTILYNKTGNASLGEESFKFGDFIKDSGIEDYVTLSEKGITFKMPINLDHADLINRNLKLLEKNFEDSEISDLYLRVLDAAYQILGEKFNEIIEDNEDFLKRSDLIYGIADGRFLEKISKDDSLKSFDEIESCLKIYKRLLLPINAEVLSSVDSQKRLAMHYATRNVTITKYGEILMQKAEESVKNLPEEEQLPITIESFNSFVSWIYERALKRLGGETQRILNTLQKILALNKEVATKLNVYDTFLETLVSRIPQKGIQQLYLEYLEETVESRTSQLKQIQKHLVEAERMAAIGEAVTMIGHDARNPLQVIFNTLYLAIKKIDEMQVSSEEKNHLKNLLEKIRNQADYINRMILDLQEYTKGVTPELIKVDLNELLEEALSSIMIPEKIEVILNVEKDFPGILADPTLMKRVLINLIKNAVEAMPEGGKIRIGASVKGSNALIEVEDTGIGIPEENMKEIFRPFFTT